MIGPVEVAIVGAILLKTFIAPAKQVYIAGAFMRERAKRPRKMSLPKDGKVYTVNAEDYLLEDGTLHTQFGIAKMVNGQRVVLTLAETKMISELTPAQTREFLEEISRRSSRQVEES